MHSKSRIRLFLLSYSFSLSVFAAGCLPTGKNNSAQNNSAQEATTAQTPDEAPVSQVETAFHIALHSSPSSVSGKIIADLTPNTVLNVIGTSGDWTQVSCGEQTGYVYSQLLFPDTASSQTALPEQSEASTQTTASDQNTVSAQSPASSRTIRLLSQEELDQIAASYDSVSKGYGAGAAKRDDKNRSQDALDLQIFLKGLDPTVFGDQDSNTIYLSFSLGWENSPNTSSILDTLSEQGVKAVFYVTHEYASKNPDLIWRMIQEGHEVGNHGYTHPEDGITTLSLNEQMQDTMKMQEYMQTMFGYTMQKYNFSSSEWSAQSVALMTQMGYQVCFYSFNYTDYDVSKPMEGSDVCQLLLDALTPGCIYYLHPVSTGNVAALPEFIEQARLRGYTFGTF